MSEESEQESADEETFDAACKENLKNILYSVKPIYCIQIGLGVFPFRIYNGQLNPSNWQMKTLSVSIIITFILIFCSRIPQICAITNVPETIYQAPGIVMLTQYVSCVITASFLVGAKNINILHNLAKLDTMLRVEKYTDFYKKSRTETVTYLIILFIIHGLNCIGDMLTDKECSIMTIASHPFYFFVKLQTLAFCKLIFMLRSRLSLLNEYLRKFIEDHDEKNYTFFTIWKEIRTTQDKTYNFIGHASERNLKLRALASIYDLIGKVNLMINEAYNFQIFMTLVTTFLFILLMMWNSLYFYRTPENVSSGPMINSFVWGFGEIYTVAVMSFACERLLLIRNETKVLVNKVIMNYDLPRIMRVQSKAFMELIEAWSLRIYVYDMFSVDITLMLKFISVATTYLILIIQISHYF